MLTLTCAPLAEPDPDKARGVLHKAWRTLRLAIAREFDKASPDRWRMAAPGVKPRKVASASREEAPRVKRAPAALPYFAVVERHQSGRPHLHILLRCGYIPQRWLSAQMRRLAQSPICDIRKVGSTQRAAAYVAKYLGKAPARFGNSRAYWYTKNWAPTPSDDEHVSNNQASWFSARRHSWFETRTEVEHVRPVIIRSLDGWFRLAPRAAPLGAFVAKAPCRVMPERPRPPPPASDAAGGGSSANRW